jgi:hypothetical protein
MNPEPELHMGVMASHRLHSIVHPDYLCTGSFTGVGAVGHIVTNQLVSGASINTQPSRRAKQNHPG